MRILGIDPGLATLGYGIIESKGKNGLVTCVNYGVISTPKDTPIGKRLFHIQQQLRVLLRLYQPDAASVETLFFFRNQKTVMEIGQVHGILSLTFYRAKTPLFRYPPLQVKNVLTGNGRAEKKELERHVKRILRLRKRIRPDDAADALGVALCHLLIPSRRT